MAEQRFNPEHIIEFAEDLRAGFASLSTLIKSADDQGKRQKNCRKLVEVNWVRDASGSRAWQVTP